MDNQSATSSKKEKREKQKVSLFCCFSSTKKQKNKSKNNREQKSNNIKEDQVVHLSNTSLNSIKDGKSNSNVNNNEINTTEKGDKITSLKTTEKETEKKISTFEPATENIKRQTEEKKIFSQNGKIKTQEIPRPPIKKESANDVKQNLSSKFHGLADEDNHSEKLVEPKPSQPKITMAQSVIAKIPKPSLNFPDNKCVTNREVTQLQTSGIKQGEMKMSSPSARNINVNNVVDFTFKKPLVEEQVEKSESSATKVNSKPISVSITESQTNHIQPSQAKLNYINMTQSISKAMSTSNGINNGSEITIHNGDNENEVENNSENIPDEEDMEFNEHESIKINDDNHSVVSSYVLSVPKMISGIESYAPSVYTRSEFKDNASNFLNTEGSHNVRLIPSGMNDTEFEITNENGEGFKALIETPRSNANYIRKARDYSYQNQQLRDIDDKIHRKEKEIKTLNEKINVIMSKIQKCEEENKKYDRWIEKEESEGEMLRHMLNFLNSNCK